MFTLLKQNSNLDHCIKVVAEQQESINLLITDMAAISKQVTGLEEKLAAVMKTIIIFAEQWHTETPVTPGRWGYKKDGTPKLKPGPALGSTWKQKSKEKANV